MQRPASLAGPIPGPFPVLMLCLLTACAVNSQIPRWFDSIQRLPVKTVAVQGHRIAYLDEGAGPPVILVHGLGGSMWQWEYQQDTLSRSHRVITLDLLGSGLSDKPEAAYTPDELVEFFGRLMDALNIRRAALAGNSMGAALVMGMALRHPERVDRLILIGGMPSGVLEKLTSPLVKRAVEARAPAWIVTLGNWFLGRGMTESVLKEIVHDPQLLTPAVLDRANRNRQRPGLIPPLLALIRNLPLWEEGFALQINEIRTPTLIIWGAEDRVFPPNVGRELHTLVAPSTFELIPETGHLPQWERPEAVNPILLKFLEPPQS
ncbi:MAG: alpha/beta fold hydrolase [Nitrospiraceae bacterium]